MNSIIINILFWGMGGTITVGLFICGVYVLIKKKKEDKYFCKTYGKIINNIQHKEVESEGRIRYYWNSLCEYSVGEERCVRKTNLGTIQPKYEIGQTVEVYYNPKNCHESYIEKDKYPGSVAAIICFALGIFSMIILFFLGKQF